MTQQKSPVGSKANSLTSPVPVSKDPARPVYAPPAVSATEKKAAMATALASAPAVNETEVVVEELKGSACTACCIVQ